MRAVVISVLASAFVCAVSSPEARQSRPELFGIVMEKAVIEETRIADKPNFDAALVRPEADKKDTDDKGSTRRLFAYVVGAGLIALLTLIASILLIRGKKSSQVKAQDINS